MKLINIIALCLFGCNSYRGSYQIETPSGAYIWATECETITECYHNISYICNNGYRLVKKYSSYSSDNITIAYMCKD